MSEFIEMREAVVSALIAANIAGGSVYDSRIVAVGPNDLPCVCVYGMSCLGESIAQNANAFDADMKITIEIKNTGTTDKLAFDNATNLLAQAHTAICESLSLSRLFKIGGYIWQVGYEIDAAERILSSNIIYSIKFEESYDFDMESLPDLDLIDMEVSVDTQTSDVTIDLTETE